MESVATILLLTLSTFLGNVIFSAIGFGMAIIFFFVFEIGSLCGISDDVDFKRVIFLQTLGVMVIQPIVLYQAGRKNLRLELLLAFIPVEFIGTPLGQMVQDITPTPILKLTVGILTIFVACFQIFNIYQLKRKQTSAKNVATPTIKNHAVFFMIGCQRSGSNWLQLLISEKYPSIASPHPPHILKMFFPIIKNFGDLKVAKNLKTLIHAVCLFINKNPVPWMDKNQHKIVFDQRDLLRRCKKTPTLLAVFEAVMNVYAKENGCTTWMCKSMGNGHFHQELKEHFGSRLKYVYLYRDPRDVCLSFRESLAVGNIFTSTST